MQQRIGKFLMFQNRLEKVFKHLSKQARKAGISCYRIYDHDLPEFPFIIEVYGGKLYVAEYQRKHTLSDDEHEGWLKESTSIMSQVLSIEHEDIFIKLRKRKQNRTDQYQKVDERKNEFIVEESNLKLIVNLSDYLDTGLFLDHRITRGMVKDMADRKKVLNLFCYTGSFSVYALAGRASEVRSVDLSKTYLDWAQRNVVLNFPSSNHKVIHADAIQYLKTETDKFDIIVMDPPTFSNSKRMEGILDIQRDHVELINDALRLLNPEGTLMFSTNFTRFELNKERINSSNIKDITKATTPFDFSGKLKRYCFQISQ